MVEVEYPADGAPAREWVVRCAEHGVVARTLFEEAAWGAADDHNAEHPYPGDTSFWRRHP